MSGPAGREPGKWDIRLVRSGDLFRAVRTIPGKTRGGCTDPECGWPVPSGVTPHNLSRDLMRHSRRTGHRTWIVTTEHVVYGPPRRQAA